jgi:hypothetical protein
MFAWTALHDDAAQDVSALKLPLLQVPGWIVTVALFDPDVYPLLAATVLPAVSALARLEL